MSLVCAELPHLAGLAHQVELLEDERVASAAVTPTGRVLLNPQWFGELELREATFVLAHELLHLALGHHQRLDFSKEARLSNLAADAVINDMLEVELRMPPPCGGMRVPGARSLSSERLLLTLRSEQVADRPSWGMRDGGDVSDETALQRSLREAGLLGDRSASGDTYFWDLLPEELEREWFLEDTRSRLKRVERVQRAIVEANALGAFQECISRVWAGTSAGRRRGYLTALETTYQPPWEMALQEWMQGAAPGERSWARPSRRSGTRTDVVLPGRSRRGWTLNIVLDTSGSMVHQHAKLLGVIASYCRGQGVEEVRLLQCDTTVTVDHRVTPEGLEKYQIRGMGGSDMGPAMMRLAEDPEVEAAIVITDGYILYPSSMPYQVLWALSPPNRSFNPRYGVVVGVDMGR